MRQTGFSTFHNVRCSTHTLGGRLVHIILMDSLAKAVKLAPHMRHYNFRIAERRGGALFDLDKKWAMLPWEDATGAGLAFTSEEKAMVWLLNDLKPRNNKQGEA